MKENLNRKIKLREPFRPFAPSILAEAAERYFGRALEAPFMITVFPVLPERRGEIPAVVHVDGTARPQLVEKGTNPRYWRLIREFETRTGVPVLLNTSFNVQEPIVCTPRDGQDLPGDGGGPPGPGRPAGLPRRPPAGVGRAMNGFEDALGAVTFALVLNAFVLYRIRRSFPWEESLPGPGLHRHTAAALCPGRLPERVLEVPSSPHLLGTRATTIGKPRSWPAVGGRWCWRPWCSSR
jgi:hypothetical protein